MAASPLLTAWPGSTITSKTTPSKGAVSICPVWRARKSASSF
jgi:hypothetical protein